MSPDERALRADVAKPTFCVGEVGGRWRLVGVTWPFAYITVTAKDGRGFALRFDCSGYPVSPPTAGLWDAGRNAPLAHNCWPRSKGGRLGAVFRPDWKGGSALYLPCDRESIAGHEGWRTQMPSKIWKPAVGIVQYLELVHELLNSTDYAAPSVAAA